MHVDEENTRSQTRRGGSMNYMKILEENEGPEILRTSPGGQGEDRNGQATLPK